MNQLAVLLDVRVRRLAAQDIDRAAFQIVWLSSVPEERTRALLAHAPGSLIPVERFLERAGEHGCLGRIVVDDPNRSEEHTSELQSLMRTSYAVFCLKKKTRKTYYDTVIQRKTNLKRRHKKR